MGIGRGYRAILAVWLVSLSFARADSAPAPVPEQHELLRISANRAWEENGVSGLHFEGDFRLEGEGWSMRA